MHLTLMEHGAYFKLLMHAWISPNCCIPDNDDWIRRVLGITMGAWKKIRHNVMKFWDKTDDGCWTQKRLLKERQKAAEKSEKNRGAAKERWKNRDGNTLNYSETNDAPALQPQSKRNAPIPIPISIPKYNISDDEFDKFWDLYPRRANKEETQKLWDVVTAKEAALTILAATKDYLEATDAKFVLNSDKFLRNEKWREYLHSEAYKFPDWLEKIKNHKLGGYECAFFMKGTRFEDTGNKSAIIYCSDKPTQQRIENYHEQIIRLVHGLDKLEVIVG